MAAKLPDKDMNELKGKVLISRVDYLSAELGDPSRYFPALRAKGVLHPEDCEKIKAKVTSSEKVYEMIELIHKRHSEKDGHAMDVLMEALRKQRVQAHIARELQRALARAKDQKKGNATSNPSSLSIMSANTPSSFSQSPTSVTTPSSIVTTPPTSAVNSMSEFEMHPKHGALPPTHPVQPSSSSAKPSVDTDPRFGVLPPTTTTTIPRNTFHPTQEERGSPGVGEVIGGMSAINLHSNVSDITSSSTYSQYHNGNYQPSHDGGERRYSDLSYTTTTGTVYSTSSNEHSGLDFPNRAQSEVRGQGEYRGSKVQDIEAKYEQAQALLKKKDFELAQLRKENVDLNNKCRELTDKYNDMKKQYLQMYEKARQQTISEQKHILDSYQPPGSGRHGDDDQLQRQLQEKDKMLNELMRQVEHYQKDNQQLQLSMSSTAITTARPHHLPIGISPGRVPTYPPSRSPFQPGIGDSTPSRARSPFQSGAVDALAAVGTTSASGITPIRSMRVGDSLNQHNIHLQQTSWSTGSYRDNSPNASKDSSKLMFSPAGRESKGSLFSPGSSCKRLSGGSGDTPMGESYFQSSSSSINSSGSKGSTGVTLQTTPNAEQHSTMV